MRKLIPDFIINNYKEKKLKGTFDGIVMKIEITGFSTLIESFKEDYIENKEIIESLCENLFNPTLSEIYKTEGFYSSFTRDCFTFVFKKHTNIYNILKSAYKIKQNLHFVKICLSFGDISWKIEESLYNNVFSFSGTAITESAFLLDYCEKNDILFDKSILKMISKEKIKYLEINENTFKLISIKTNIKELANDEKNNLSENIEDNFFEKFIPEKIINFDKNNNYYDAVSIFMSFKDFDKKNATKNFIKFLLNKANKYGGFFNKIEIDNKGNIIQIIFAPPLAGENILLRAVDFIYEIKQKYGQNVKAGLENDISYISFIGNKNIQDYTILGEINYRSFAYMIRANWGEVVISEKISEEIKSYYKVKIIGEVKFKENNQSNNIFLISNKRENLKKKNISRNFLDRKEELKILEDISVNLYNGKFKEVVEIYGSFGIGKSRLIEEFCNEQKHVNIVEIKPNKNSENVINDYITNFFNEINLVSLESKKKNFENILLKIKENTEKSFDYRRHIVLNKINSIDFDKKEINNFLFYTVFFQSLSLNKPLIIIFEDIENFYKETLEFISFLSREMFDFPFMCIVTRNKTEEKERNLILLDKKINLRKINLDTLKNSDSKKMIKNILSVSTDEKIIKNIQKKSNNIPLKIEQLSLIFKKKDINTEMIFPDSLLEIFGIRIEKLISDVEKSILIIEDSEEIKNNYKYDRFIDNEIIQNEKAFVSYVEKQDFWKEFLELKNLIDCNFIFDKKFKKNLNQKWKKLYDLITDLSEKLYRNFPEKFLGIAENFKDAGNFDKSIIYYEKAVDFYEKNFELKKVLHCLDNLISISYENTKKILEYYYKKSIALDNMGLIDEELYVLNLGLNISLENDYFLENIKFKLQLSWVLYNKGEYEKSLKICEECIIISEKNDFKEQLGISYENMGRIFYEKGEYEKALDYYEKRKIISYEMEDKKGYSSALGNMAIIYHIKGKYNEAIKLYEERIKIATEINDMKGLSTSLNNLGILYIEKNDYKQAMNYYKQAKKICEKIGDKRVLSRIFGNIGIIYDNKGNYDKALSNYLRNKDLCEELEDKKGLSVALGNIGNIYLFQGKYDEALKTYDDQEKICKELEDKSGISLVYSNKGELYLNKGIFDEALNYLEESIKIDKELKDRKGLSISYSNVGNVLYYKKKYDEALKYYEKAISLAEKLEFNYYLSGFLSYKSKTLYELKNYEECEKTLKKAKQILKKMERREIYFEVEILSSKILALSNENAGCKQIKALLESVKKQEERARVYYELWKIKGEEMHKNISLNKYYHIYSEFPKYDYKLIIEELTDSES